MANTTILGVLLRKRTVTSPEFQKILTKHGCIIKIRIGIHNATNDICLPDGVILLDIIGTESDKKALEDDIKTLDGADVQKMVFEF